MLLNLERLVRAIEGRSWDVQNERRGLDGDCGRRAAGVALVGSTAVVGHLGGFWRAIWKHSIGTRMNLKFAEYKDLDTNLLEGLKNLAGSCHLIKWYSPLLPRWYAEDLVSRFVPGEPSQHYQRKANQCCLSTQK